MRFFFDNNITPKIVRVLRVLDERDLAPNLVHLRDRFPADVADPQWIRQLGGEGDWVIVSGDRRISRSPPERAAWLESGLTAFFFGDAWTNRHLYDQAAEMIAAWRDIVRHAHQASAGAGFSVAAGSGVIKQIYPRMADSE